jgi:hypothetical protein
MQLAENLQVILDRYDFTESIVTQITWENNLFDLSLTLDYWWNLDEDISSSKGYGTKMLKLTFTDCLRTNFIQDSRLMEMKKGEIHPPSWFTIVNFRTSERSESEGLLELEVVTLDYNNPWLSVSCKGIKLERV